MCKHRSSRCARPKYALHAPSSDGSDSIVIVVRVVMVVTEVMVVTVVMFARVVKVVTVVSSDDWGERSEPLPSQLNVNFVSMYLYIYVMTGSILASLDDALYRVYCYVSYRINSN